MASLRKRGKTWYVRYRDEHGRSVETKAGPDKRVATQMAASLGSQVAQIKAGTLDARVAVWADAERRSIAEHVHDWRAYLLAKGSTTTHAGQSESRVLRLIESAKILRISGLTLSAVQSALADLVKVKGRRGNDRLSERSVSHHARALKSFSRWLWRDGRVREDALVHLELPEVNEEFTRQALEPEEAVALIATTPTQPVRMRMTGRDRSVLYATALGTGFRLGELQSLTPEAFDLDASPPTITCQAEHTKNRKIAIQPIRPELAEMLQPWLAGRAAGRLVFVLRRDRAARTVRLDLEAAGIDSASTYDFHSLRHSFVTHVVKSGASVKVCQELARHSDPRLTMNTYSHLTVHDLAHGLEGLAHSLPTAAVSTGLTGTDCQAVISSPGRTGMDPSRHTYQSHGP